MQNKLDVAEIQVGDLPDLAAFYTEQGAGPRGLDPETARRHLHWYLFEVPAASDELPKGWVARDGAGRVVGAKRCTPQRFQCAGTTWTLAHGGGYYVDASHRGLGLLLMRRFLGLGDRYALFAATMNDVSGALYERYGGYPIPRTDAELIGPIRWTPLLEEALVRRGVPATLAGAAAWLGALRPSPLRGGDRGTLSPVTSADALPESVSRAPAEHAQQLTALRDRAFLRWRYFEGPDATRSLYRYEGPSGACWVGVNLRRRGHRSQVRALMVLDVWGDLPAAATPDLARALADRHRDEADVLVFRGMPEPRERALCERGFVRRALSRAVGVCIDRSALLPTRDWYLVPADGDMGH